MLKLVVSGVETVDSTEEMRSAPTSQYGLHDFSRVVNSNLGKMQASIPCVTI